MAPADGIIRRFRIGDYGLFPIVIMNERKVFIVSDRTGITAEAMAHSLLSQFPAVRFRTVFIPFVDSTEKAREVIAQINRAAKESGQPPLVFATLVDEKIRETLCAGNGVFFDLFDAFIAPLERELGAPSSHTAGLAHGVTNPDNYRGRISAINFALRTDDGLHSEDYERAALIVLGVSRVGKTPTCLYLALQYGVPTANHPLTPEDFDRTGLPESLRAHRGKLFGLTIRPERLQQIRQERRRNTGYAELERCQSEIGQAEALYRRERIPYLDSTSMSIEEIATTILYRAHLREG
jgi:regulator of PEP synthase PpsR (kinase-PPPase family)